MAKQTEEQKIRIENLMRYIKQLKKDNVWKGEIQDFRKDHGFLGKHAVLFGMDAENYNRLSVATLCSSLESAKATIQHNPFYRAVMLDLDTLEVLEEKFKWLSIHPSVLKGGVGV